ncbi:MAG TPA: cupredoxin domain-containing protein [Kofleriaceae bacterium]|nr:cupredoxin domain-containing protein [Kofleriaceae bacterium]
MVHDQSIFNSEARLAAELGIRDGLAAGLMLPLRVYRTTIRYLGTGGEQVAIENPNIHHRNETLAGMGDPWLVGRVSHRLGGFLVGARLGVSLPLGRTEPDPFELGDMGLPHEHSQFGTGTLLPIAGVEAVRVFDRFSIDAAALTVQSVYANGRGYQAGDRYAGALGVASALGTKRWRFRIAGEAQGETAERWHGMIHAEEGNTGRVDVLAGLEATWLCSDDWHVSASLRLPVYTRVEGGQLDVTGFAGVSFGTHFHLFEGAGHEREHGHEHAKPGDWAGLDKADLTDRGEAVDLVPVAGKITVFDFWATWCEPCKVLDGELAEVARRHPEDVAIRKINTVDTDSPASQRYLADATLPHIKVYGRDGKPLFERSASPVALAAEVEKAVTGARARVAVPPDARRISIDVVDAGYAPARVEVKAGEPVVLVFTRRSEATCATDVHFTLPDGTRIDEELPRGKPIEIPLRIDRAGEVTYACGMRMLRGTIVVR